NARPRAGDRSSVASIRSESGCIPVPVATGGERVSPDGGGAGARGGDAARVIRVADACRNNRHGRPPAPLPEPSPSSLPRGRLAPATSWRRVPTGSHGRSPFVVTG